MGRIGGLGLPFLRATWVCMMAWEGWAERTALGCLWRYYRSWMGSERKNLWGRYFRIPGLQGSQRNMGPDERGTQLVDAAW